MSDISTEIRMKCRVYTNDTDGVRLSLHRLIEFIEQYGREAVIAELKTLPASTRRDKDGVLQGSVGGRIKELQATTTKASKETAE